ncbi:MAG: hypothetical protein ABSA42_22145 [Terracidiphilus sp.]
MFLDVEDLADERDGRAGRDGSHGVKRGRETFEARPREAAGDVEDGDHGDDEQVALTGTELVPMRRNKEHHAAGQQNGAESESRDHQPLEACGTGGGRGSRWGGDRCPGGLRGAVRDVLRFQRANAGGCVRIEDAGRLPACQQRVDFVHGGCAP